MHIRIWYIPATQVTPGCALDLLLVDPLVEEPLKLTGGFVTAQYSGGADHVTAYACRGMRYRHPGIHSMLQCCCACFHEDQQHAVRTSDDEVS